MRALSLFLFSIVSAAGLVKISSILVAREALFKSSKCADGSDYGGLELGGVICADLIIGI
ncbi:MAG TPA: hypothetical protein DCL32_06900 [Gammaproteobacteria bacterium]|nr:hypothetical protein [Gammaproteobacteria bacterium]